MFVFAIKHLSELGEGHPGNRLQRSEKQFMQTDLPGQNVSHLRLSVSTHLVHINPELDSKAFV